MDNNNTFVPKFQQITVSPVITSKNLPIQINTQPGTGEIKQYSPTMPSNIQQTSPFYYQPVTSNIPTHNMVPVAPKSITSMVPKQVMLTSPGSTVNPIIQTTFPQITHKPTINPAALPQIIHKPTINPTVPVTHTQIAPKPTTLVVPKPMINLNILPQVTPIIPKPVITPKINTFAPFSPSVVPSIYKPTINPTGKVMLPLIAPKLITQTKFLPQTINNQENFVAELSSMEANKIIQYANTLDQANFAKLLGLLADYYHNDESLVSDDIYDELIDIYEAKYQPYTIVGAEPTGEKIQLPYYLGSLRKIKKDSELIAWLELYPGPYIIEDKIDGLSLLYISKNIMGKQSTVLYTRGGGYKGRDVSHLLAYMNLPILNIDIAIRGEVVLTKDAFAKIGSGFKNARNLASGIINATKQFNPTLARELSFYAYRIMNKNMTAEEDINELRMLGFMVPNPVSAQTLTKDILENYYSQRKKNAPYEMDGLVIYQNRINEYPVGETPRHVVAFKTGTETGVTTVTRVTWRASKDKLLKPVVHYEPINLSGADLQKASGYNAKFIVNNNIGPGAKILITRSGDVIPKILSVISPSLSGPDYPDPIIHGNYSWNENQVEFVVTEENPEVIAGRLKHFLDTLGIKNFGMKRVEAFVNAGIRNITILLQASPEQFGTIPGIGTTLSNQIYSDIHKHITNVPLSRIMDASGIFDKIGERSFEAILEFYPNLLDLAKLNTDEIAENLRNVKGFNTKANEIAENLPYFVEWLHGHPMITIEQPKQHHKINIQQHVPQNIYQQNAPQDIYQQRPPQDIYQQRPPQDIYQQHISLPTKDNKLIDKTFVFSGFRDKDLENKIRNMGGKVSTSVSRNTSMLIMKDLSPKSLKGKAIEAQNKGIQLITREQFIQQYLT